MSNNKYYNFEMDNILKGVLIISVLSFAALQLYFTVSLKFDFMRSDVLWYYNDSLNWHIPFNRYHVPFYPLLIALFDFISINMLDSVSIMMIINLISQIMACYYAFRIILLFSKNKILVFTGVTSFTFWPITGLTYSVYPLSDMLAIMLYTAGFYYLLNKREILAFSLWGICLISHKALWLFVAFGFIFYLIENKFKTPKNSLISILFLITPILILWFCGYLFHGSADWLIFSSLEIESDRTYFIFDGIIRSLTSGSIIAISKGIVCIILISVNILLLFLIAKEKDLLYPISIILATLLLIAFLNETEIISAIRFSRIMIFPLIFMLSRKVKKEYSLQTILIFNTCLYILLMVTQFVFAWYIAKVFFA